MTEKLNPIHQQILSSLMTQAEHLSKHDALHYDNVTDVYREIIILIAGCMNPKEMDVMRATKLIKDATDILFAPSIKKRAS